MFDRIRELAETTCSNIISVTPEVFVNMKEVKKFVNSENHGRKTRSTHQKKKKRPFWHARRLLCKDIKYESTAARGKDGSCEVWYEFDNKNGLTPDWVDEEWLEHQVDRAFCLWSKFFDIHFRRTKPKDCHSPACLGQSSEIKITWAKSEKKYNALKSLKNTSITTKVNSFLFIYFSAVCTITYTTKVLYFHMGIARGGTVRYILNFVPYFAK